MPLNDLLLPEFDQEMAVTRKVLDRVTDETFAFKPHEKSSAMGSLAIHMARIPTWVKIVVDQPSLDLAAQGPPDALPATREELLALFDKNAAEGHQSLAGVADETFSQPWSLMSGPATLLTLPKFAVYRGFVMNHLIHHRGQLSVYLRLNDIPVPSIYGPSADEAGF